VWRVLHRFTIRAIRRCSNRILETGWGNVCSGFSENAALRLKRKRSAAVRPGRREAGLFEQLFRCNRDAIGDLRGAVEDLQHLLAERAAKLARRAAPRRKLDAPETGVALRADDIASSHARIMHRCDDRSTTARVNLHALRHASGASRRRESDRDLE